MFSVLIYDSSKGTTMSQHSRYVQVNLHGRQREHWTLWSYNSEINQSLNHHLVGKQPYRCGENICGWKIWTLICPSNALCCGEVTFPCRRPVTTLGSRPICALAPASGSQGIGPSLCYLPRSSGASDRACTLLRPHIRLRLVLVL